MAKIQPSPKCPKCGSANADKIRPMGMYDYWHCNKCHHCWLEIGNRENVLAGGKG